MSYLCSFIELINKYCNEEPRIEDLLKKIEPLEKENDSLQTQIREHEKENMQLQMELFKLETMAEPLRHMPDEENIETINMQLMETSSNIRYAISHIDFSKIIQCNHNQMENNYRKEWQQLQEYTVSMLQWHEKMEQRDVVQKYRKVEKNIREMEQHCQRNSNEHNQSIKQSLARLGEAKYKLNMLIICLADGSWKLIEQQEIKSHANILIDLKRQLGDLQDYSMQNNSLSAFVQYDMPKFPSFNDIIKSFDLDLNQGEVTMIENTTNIMVKSILRNTQDNSMEYNHSITTKHIKHVHFKMHLEDKTERNESTVSDYSSDDSADTKIEIIQKAKETKMKEQTANKNAIPAIGLFNSSDTENFSDKENPTIKQTKNPKIDIIECIVVKPATTENKQTDDIKTEAKTNNKENIDPQAHKSLTSPEDDTNLDKSIKEIMPPPKQPGPSRRKKATYEEYLKSFSLEASSDDSSASPSRISKDFDMIFRQNINVPEFMKSGSIDEHDNGPNDDDVDKGIGEELEFGTHTSTFGTNDGDDMFARSNIMDFFN